MASERLQLAGDDARPRTLVDSCVILDVLTDDPAWAEWSAGQLAQARDQGLLVINPIVYAEISVGFDAIETLDAILDEDYTRHPLPWTAGFLAGKAYQRHRKSEGQKRSPLPDFYIGAHAAVAGFRLLTRDAKRYRMYFPKVEIICPV
ncbi:type II toxin-antitoxin system VapC family toxin [Streptomyces sp. KLOTTS4A1]|uniref:type II toxin-antitoxin system VapC family toxin n=1 Tax=Streptomyces sp. KLOTTS4A1 TaxID=3390996 RepID=UPI0039F5A9DC